MTLGGSEGDLARGKLGVVKEFNTIKVDKVNPEASRFKL